MKFTVSLTFDSIEEMQSALDKLNSVNSSPESKQTKTRKKSNDPVVETKPVQQESVSESDVRALLIKYRDTEMQTMDEIKSWMKSSWGSEYLKDIDPKFFPDIKKEVEAKLCSQKTA